MDPSQPLTTGIPWLDKSIAVLFAVGAICSLASHSVSTDSAVGKVVSWMALNFGKNLAKKGTDGKVVELVPPPKGFARVRTLLAILAIGTLCGCAFMAREFGSTLAKDELDCGKDAYHAVVDAFLPQLSVLFATASSQGLAAALAQLEEDAVSALGPAARDGLTCAARTIVADYEKAHQQPESFPLKASSALAACAGDNCAVSPPDPHFLCYARASEYVEKRTAAQ